MKRALNVLLCMLFPLLMLTQRAVAEDVAQEAATETDEPWYKDLDLDPFNQKGFTPRYAYLDFDNFIGYAHYFGVSYYKKAGAESEGVTLRTAQGTMGEKFNLAYSNSFSFMSVDFGLSYYHLDSDNPRKLEYEELLGIEMGLRFWVIQIIGVHTENTSFVTLGYGF